MLNSKYQPVNILIQLVWGGVPESAFFQSSPGNCAEEPGSYSSMCRHALWQLNPHSRLDYLLR